MDELSAFLEVQGFGKIMTNLPEFVFFYRQEMQSVNVVLVIDYRSGYYITWDQYDHIRETIRHLFHNKGISEIHILSLILCQNPERAKALSREDRFCWMLDLEQNRLMIYENQVSDFYGIKGKLEQFLEERESLNRITEEKMKGQAAPCRAISLAGIWDSIYRLPLVNILLVGINVILFLICTWGTDLLYNKGDLVGSAVLEGHEYYRIITSMFLHADISHLFSNMLALYFLGEGMEEELGHIRYVLLYFLSGIGASWVSVAYKYMTKDFVGSVGASGAIYGVLGALLYMVACHKGRYRNATLPRFLLFLVYSLYSGIRATNVDNAAHIGGLICGFALMFILRKRRKINEN